MDLVEEGDIETVRRKLDDLVVARSLYGWSGLDRVRFQSLCERERSLLWPLSSSWGAPECPVASVGREAPIA